MARLDRLWKSVIEEFFPHFLAYFFEAYFHLIDLEKGFEFMDKELHAISKDSKDDVRIPDVLAKIYLKNGKHIAILIHVEVQGYVDKNFAERMYIQQYRIRERFKMPTAALAIFTDNSPSFHPKSYQSNIFGTSIQYDYATYKLRDQKLKDIRRKENNPFSLILEAAWWGLSKNKLDDEQLFKRKYALCKRMVKIGFDIEHMRGLFDFIKLYVKFERPGLYDQLDNQLNSIIENIQDMSIREAFIENFKEEGREEGSELVVEIFNRLKKGEKIEAISKAMNVPLEKVKKYAKIFL